MGAIFSSDKGMAQSSEEQPSAQSSEESLNFYIFGNPVTMSPSPDMQNVGFAVNGFPHKYHRFDSPDVAEVIAKLRSADCGGGSVTIPHKEGVHAVMDELSEAARITGAVNTVTKVDGRFKGDNTDWIGIKKQLESRLPSPLPSPLCCLLCGAGGTAKAAAYALKQMGAHRVLIYNRTLSRAEDLAAEFGFEACGDLNAGLEGLEELHVVVNTLPGNTGFCLPEGAASQILARSRPAVLEAAYIPRRTAFVKQALAAGCEVVEGIEMLFEQGCAQCEIWTGKPAPRAKIASALLKALFTEGSEHPAHPKMEPYDELPKSLVREAASGE
ncbi:unnamed protein product [Polarella glacialis]|uniref:Shikimate dehydrogenase n=1 Tax=Polarella glacialis TaxID=89957 RepID=A0A813H0C5_POLGL|nr:unnamed protein product [Polarella glacialis]CAE8662181.1 unnamed protein product [Polarella glacialis]